MPEKRSSTMFNFPKKTSVQKEDIQVKSVDIAANTELAEALGQVADVLFAQRKVEPEQHETFYPHLEGVGPEKPWLGKIGTPTNFKDSMGTTLRIGDVVEAFGNMNNGHHSMYSIAVVGAVDDYIGPLGFGSNCNQKDGIIEGMTIFKVRNFDAFSDGDFVVSAEMPIHYILVDRKKA